MLFTLLPNPETIKAPLNRAQLLNANKGQVSFGTPLFGTREPRPASLSDQDLSEAWAIAKEVSASSLKEYLSAVVGTRNRFTSQEKMAQVECYICETFKKYGWIASKQNFHYETFHGANVDGSLTPKTYNNLEGVNIVATKTGEDAERVIVIGAHYDTVNNSPGADDNGTGIAALLELARILGRHSYSKTLVLVAFDMEEIGFAGSVDFVRKLLLNAMVEGAIIFETVGYIVEEENTQKIPSGFSLLYGQQVEKVKRNQHRGNFITVIHNGKSKKLASLFAGANLSLKDAVPLVFIRDALDLPILGVVLKRLFPLLRNLLRSDHVPFWQAKIPAIQLTDTANFRNPNYHRPTDTLETVNFSVLQRLVQAVAITAIALAEVQE